MNTVRKVAVFLVMMLLISISSPIEVLATTYKDMGKKIGVKVDEARTIKFNQDINGNTINGNVVVLNDKNVEVPVKVELKDSKTVVVTPVSNYEAGKTYSLIVKEGVQDKSGKRVKSPAKMMFTVENKIENPTSPKGYIVALDAGRAANDIGAQVGPTGILGKDINLSVALKTGKILEAQGIKVVYTRTGDNVSWSKDDSIEARSKIINDAKANLMLSIHCNASTITTASGSETYYLKGDSESKKLAAYVQDGLPAKTGLPNRGIIESSLKTLSSVSATSVYVDLGFITNPTEEKILNSEAFKNSSAEALANAVIKYLDIKQSTYIKDIRDISALLYKGESYSLPTSVDAVMSDNTDTKVPVKWDKTSVDTSKEGTYYYKGTVAGYAGNVTLKVVVVLKPSSNTSQISKVAIDPSSAANLLGSTGPTGIKEKDVNLAIALKLGKLLQDKGIEVVYTRTTDSVTWSENVDNEQRSKIANDAGAELLVSIHTNSFTTSTANGIETYYMPGDNVGKSLAQSVQTNMIASTLGYNRGAKEKSFKLLEGFNGTGIFVYPGFITNPNEEALLNTSSYQDKIAEAIARSITGSSGANQIIKSVNDITITMLEGNKYSLPTKVSAVTSDDKLVQADIIWETNTVDTSKVGTQFIKGRVVNYTGQVTLTLMVLSKNGTNYKVAIDPGHGGTDPGAIGVNGTKEKDIALAISLKLGDILVKNGVQVVYTRTSDSPAWLNNKDTRLQTRVDIANDASVNYFVSLHANSISGSPTTSGIETYYDRERTNGIPLATNIQSQLIQEFGAKDRGIKSSGLFVVKYTKAPAVLVELEFLSNPEKEKLMKDPVYQQRYAEAIARGIMNTLGK